MEWIVVEVDGKIASVSPDFRMLAEIAGGIARQPVDSVSEIKCTKASTVQINELSEKLKWEDLNPQGSEFQKHVWKQLFYLTHRLERNPQETDFHNTQETECGTAAGGSMKTDEDKSVHQYSELLSYSDFAKICGNKDGVRAVAHAVACNPIAIIIPCHLIVPKQTIDKIRRLEEEVAPTLFGNWLMATTDLNFGEYRYGPDLKKQLITGLELHQSL